MGWEDYFRPQTLREALDILSRHRGKGRVIAGGTDLLLDLKNAAKEAAYLVDIREIEGLTRIEEKDGRLFIGACVTHSQLAANPLIREKAAALAEGAATVGSVQVRNVSTIGGNIVNAQPAADTVVPLVALGASAAMADWDGTKRVAAVEDLFAGPGKSKIDSTRTILTEVSFPAVPSTLSAFDRIARRKSLSLPMLNLAVAVQRENNAAKNIRIAAGPIGPTPRRLKKVESILEGQAIEPGILAEAARAAGEGADPRDSVLRGPRDYRKEMIGVMLTRTLNRIWNP
jgi:carbon-monoxide dehydrogenase medium subunit